MLRSPFHWMQKIRIGNWCSTNFWFGNAQIGKSSGWKIWRCSNHVIPQRYLAMRTLTLEVQTALSGHPESQISHRQENSIWLGCDKNQLPLKSQTRNVIKNQESLHETWHGWAIHNCAGIKFLTRGEDLGNSLDSSPPGEMKNTQNHEDRLWSTVFVFLDTYYL